jgi:hypothetical protein
MGLPAERCIERDDAETAARNDTYRQAGRMVRNDRSQHKTSLAVVAEFARIPTIAASTATLGSLCDFRYGTSPRR